MKMMSFIQSVLVNGFCLKKVSALDLQWTDKQCRFFLRKEHFGAANRKVAYYVTHFAPEKVADQML